LGRVPVSGIAWSEDASRRRDGLEFEDKFDMNVIVVDWWSRDVSRSGPKVIAARNVGRS